MKKENLHYFLARVFAYFVKNPPAENSAVYCHAAQEFVDGCPNAIPDVAIDEIANAFAYYEKFPQNPIFAIIKELEKWKSNHPQSRKEVKSCPLCVNHPGYVYVFREGENRCFLAKCRCSPNANDALDLPVADEEFLKRTGCKIGKGLGSRKRQ